MSYAWKIVRDFKYEMTGNFDDCFAGVTVGQPGILREMSCNIEQTERFRITNDRGENVFEGIFYTPTGITLENENICEPLDWVHREFLGDFSISYMIPGKGWQLCQKES